MIVCTKCGHRNEDTDDFCGSCGDFLEFTGERIEQPSDPEPEPEAEPDPVGPTIVERVRTAVGLDREIGDDGAEVGPVEEVAASSGDDTDETDDGARSSSAAARRRAEAERAADEAARVADEARRAAEEAAREAVAETRRADDAARSAAREREAREAAEAAASTAQEEARTAEERAQVVAAEAAEEIAEERAARERAEREAAERAASAEAAAAEQLEREQSARTEADGARAEAEERLRVAEQARIEAEERAAEAERAARAAALVAQPRKTTPVSEPPREDPSVTGADQAAGAEDVQAQKPQQVKRRRAKASAPDTDEFLNPGDLICGQCGVGNEPTRNFCRRCGHSLVEAEVAAKLPWYRRLFSRKPKPESKPAAGTRNVTAGGRSGPNAVTRGKYAFLKFRSLRGKVGRVLALLAVVGVAGFSLGPGRDTVTDWYDSAKGVVFPEFDPVRPASASATSSLDGHPATAAIDQITNTYWAEGAEGDGEGEGLSFDFEEPIDLAKVGFTSGASGSPEEFVTQPRIHELQLLFDDGSTEMIELDDEADFQSFEVERSGVKRVQLQILSTYPSLEGAAASLAEIEFFIES